MTYRTALLALFVLACGGSEHVRTRTEPGRPSPAGASVPQGRLPADVRPTHYALSLEIRPDRERFSGTAEIDVRLPRPTNVVYLHGRNLSVHSARATANRATMNGEWRTVDEERGLASLTFDRPLVGAVRIAIAYDAPFDRTLEGLYHVEQAGKHYAFTQFEPLSARRAFPCFDEPSFKTPFDVTLLVAEHDRVIANTAEVASEPAGDGMRRVRFATTQPLPTYLVAFAVGPLDVVEAPPIPPNDVRSAPLPLRGVAPSGQGANLAYALAHTPAIVASLERYFGIAYPYGKLDLIAVPDFGAGAMENAGAITFRDSLLLVGANAPMRQQRAFAYVTAHELAHQWVGNLVTMEWWNDLWLNEAFATWMETRTIGETFPEHAPDVAQMFNVLEAMHADSLASARQIRQPIASDHDIHNAFDDITYSKGDAVLAMFERWLGPEVFRRGLTRYLRDHSHANATSEDLFAALSAESGRDVAAPFTTFVSQPGVPIVTVTPRCAEGSGSLALRQMRYAPLGSRADRERRWQIPFCARYAVSGQTHEACTLLTSTEGTLALPDGCAQWVLPNRDGAGYYRFSLPPDAIATLVRARSALSVRETLALADSIEASFDSGAISFEDALRALEPLAASEERALAKAPMELLRFAIERVLDPPARERARRYASRLYRAQLARLGWRARRNESPETLLLRADLLSFLALVANDEGVRRDAARRGNGYLDGRTNAVPSDLAELAATVAVQEGGAARFDRALARLPSTTDPVVRGNLVRALASVRDPALRPRALELSLDDRLRVNEVYRPIMAQFSDPEGTQAAWAWLTGHYDQLAARIGPEHAGYLPFAASSFCDAARTSEVRAFFAPRMASTEGGPRNLESALETIELCAARRAHAQPSAAAFFAR